MKDAAPICFFCREPISEEHRVKDCKREMKEVSA